MPPFGNWKSEFSGEQPKALGITDLYRPLKILSAFWQVAQMGAEKIDADVILVDIGPNLGAINRSVLTATDFVAIPLAADLFSLQGLQNIGPTLREWRLNIGFRHSCPIGIRLR